MANENMFETAVKGKFRFPFKGQVSAEDLFDLSVESLDSVFKVLNSQMKQAKEESLLDTKSKEDNELDLKIEIVKYIVSIKLAEKIARAKAREQKEKKEKLLEIISAKQDQDLQSKSVDELIAMFEELNG